MERGRVYNRIYTPELWEQVNPKNKEILKDFLEELRQKKKSKGTIDGYFQDARIIFIYVLKFHDNKSILTLNKKNFRSMSLWLSEDCGLSANRVNRLKSTINSMLTFCEEDDDYDYDINYAKKVSGLPIERVKVDENDFFFTFNEFISVRNKLVKMEDYQLASLWSLAFDSGARKNEICQVKKHNLLEGNQTNIVRGKRGKMFSLIYFNDTRDLIKEYLDRKSVV